MVSLNVLLCWSVLVFWVYLRWPEVTIFRPHDTFKRIYQQVSGKQQQKKENTETTPSPKLRHKPIAWAEIYKISAFKCCKRLQGSSSLTTN